MGGTKGAGAVAVVDDEVLEEVRQVGEVREPPPAAALMPFCAAGLTVAPPPFLT